LLQSKRIHWTALLQGFLLFVLALSKFRLLVSGEILMYVSPRMLPFTQFAVVLMALMAVICLTDLKKIPRGRTYLSIHVFFGFPVIAMLIFSPVALTAADLPSRSMDPGFAASSEEGPARQDRTSQMLDSYADAYTGEEPLVEQYQLRGSETDLALDESETIEVTSDHFYLWINELFQYPENLEGKKIRVEGFVHRDQVLTSSSEQDDDFWVSRFLMVCCVADVVLVGLPVENLEQEEIPDESWVRVEGRLVFESARERTMPLIRSAHITYIEPPQHPYVFPY